MNTILYFDRHTVAEANEMAVTATARYGVAPTRMQIGRDVTVEEVEDLCVIDINKTSIPFITSADSDDVIDLYDRDEEVENDTPDETWLFGDYSGN